MTMRRFLSLAAVLLATSACRDVPTQLLRDAIAPQDCPADIGMGPMLNGKFLKDSTKSKYLTVIVDGKVARWNFNETKGGPLDIPGYPAMDEVKSVRMLSHTLSYTEISRRYGTCLGVGVQLVETKSGSWAPIASPYRQTSVAAK